MDKVQKRQKEIKDLLATTEFISVQSLAERLGVTGATIRKDLRELESKREIFRTRGGVSLVRPRIIDLSIREKIFINAEKKNKIAAAAAKLVGQDDSIIVSSGSTIDAMARVLTPKGHLTVVTPSVAVAFSLAQKENIDVMILGGHIVKNSLSVRDAYTLEGLKHVSCTKLFFSCDGLDLKSGVITAFVDEARMTERLMQAAARSILLADSSKVGKTGIGKICEITDIDTLITDKDLPASVLSRLEAAGVQVIIAE